MARRPELRLEWIALALEQPIKVMIQRDGRVRHWVYITQVARYLRVVTLGDGETVHNAFFDRRFKL